MKSHSKLIGLVALVVLVLIACALIFIFIQKNASTTLTTTSTTSTPSGISNSEATSTMMVPYSFSIPHTNFVIYRDSIKNPKTGDTVTFVSSEAESGTVTVYDVLLDGIKIGTVGGYPDSNPIFSPNYKYASFGSTAPEGSSGEEYWIHVIDFQDKKVILVPTPQHFNSTFNGENDVIDSYSWDSASDSLDVTTFVTKIENGKLYRISPKQMWSYNLATGQYVLNRTLPE